MQTSEKLARSLYKYYENKAVFLLYEIVFWFDFPNSEDAERLQNVSYENMRLLTEQQKLYKDAT